VWGLDVHIRSGSICMLRTLLAGDGNGTTELPSGLQKRGVDKIPLHQKDGALRFSNRTGRQPLTDSCQIHTAAF
jgi:hypothetical protein